MENKRLEFAKSRLEIDDYYDIAATNCLIGKDVSLPSDVIIGNGVTICGHVRIGNGCIIRSGAIIGHPGFSFGFTEEGVPVPIKHDGGIIIGDNVLVGANNVISQGTLEPTVLSDHVKLDDLIHVAHNNYIGPRTIVASGANFAGSCHIGADVWIGSMAAIKNKVTVGDGALVGTGSVVIKDVPPGVVVAGNPARVLRERRENEQKR